jgi:hypothetical protein
LLIALLGAAIALLPVARFNAFNPYNDTFTYISISDHLQTHAFSVPADPEPYFPFLSQTRLYQEKGLRMGAVFLLALAQSLAFGRRAIDLYPALAAWGVALNVLAVFLLCRWSALLSRRLAFAAAWLAAVVPNPFHYAASNGFLPQLLGTAFFALGLAWLARLARGGRRPAAFGLALALAALSSAYSELSLPMLFIILPVFVTHLAGRARLSARLRGWGRAGLLTLLFTHIELVRMWSALPEQIAAKVGRHIPYSPLEFLGNALGANPGPWTTETVHFLWRYPPRMLNGAAALLGVLALTGLVALLRRRAGRGSYFWALAFLAALFGWFALAVKNPFLPGLTGQSWSEFKITQWSYPLLLPLLMAGTTRLPRPRVALAALLLLLTPFALKIHSRISHIATFNALQWTGTGNPGAPFANHPFAAYAALADEVNRRQPEGIVELRFSPERPQHRQLVVYYLAPRRLVGDWREDGYLNVALSPQYRNLTLAEPHLILRDAPVPELATLPAGVTTAADPAAAGAD